MRTWQLIVLRLYMGGLGRIPVFAKLMRNLLLVFVVRGPAGARYTASSKYFNINDLEPQ